MKIMNRIKITKNRVVACFAAILLLLPATVGAQHFDAHIAGRKVTLQECFDLAARQNLQMQAGKKSVERAQVMQGTAWELDKTEVAFSQNPATGGESDNGFTFTQSLDFPTVYASRRNQLKAETQAEKSRLNVVSQQLKAEIANTYYQMLYQTHRLQILERIDSVLERYSQIAEMRYKAGESRQLEYLSADRKCNENRLEMADVKSEIERLQIDLMTQINTQEPIKPAEENLSAIAAQNIGAGQQERAERTLRYGALIAFTVGVIFGIIFQFAARPVISLFTAGKDPQVIELGSQYIRTYVWDCALAGIHFTFSGFFSACGRSMISFIHNIIAIVTLRIPLAWLASVYFPATLWQMGIAPPAGSLLSALICIGVYLHLKKKGTLVR